MSVLIKFAEGTYNIRGVPQSVAGMIFPLVEETKQDDNGYYVTVDARAVRGFPDRNIRIRTSSATGTYSITNDVVTDHLEDRKSTRLNSSH